MVETKENILKTLNWECDWFYWFISSNNLNERDSFGFRRRRIATTEEEEKEVAQLTDLQLEVLIKQLEERKLKLENILEIHNANTQLIE